MTALVLKIYNLLQTRRGPLFLLSGLLFALCLLGSYKLKLNEDISALIPSEPPEISRQFTHMLQAPFSGLLAISLGSALENSLDTAETTGPEALADAVAEAIRSPLIPKVIVGPPAFSPASLSAFYACIPALLTPQDMDTLKQALKQEQMSALLGQNTRELLGPSGPALRGLVALDPLRIRELLSDKLRQFGQMGSFSSRNGHFVDATGRHALLLAKPAAPISDTLTATQILKQVEFTLAALPANIERHLSGGHRHSQINALTVKKDLRTVLPLSFALVGGLFLLFLRRGRALGIMLVPVFAVSLGGMVLMTLYGSVSGIVLAFGSILLGITSDYAIHVYYALTFSNSCQEGLGAVTSPLLAAFGTTAAGFTALYFSGIPAIRQVSLFGLSGLTAALFFALLVLPHMLRPCGRTNPTPGATAKSASQTGQACRIKALPTAIFAGLACALSVGFFLQMRFDGDIRSLSRQDPDIRADEAAFRRIWQKGQDSVFTVAEAINPNPDEALEQALRINENLYAILGEAGAPTTSLAPLLPPLQSQTERLKAWEQLWESQGADAAARLSAIGQEAGFAQNAFVPFENWIKSPPQTIGPEQLREFGADFLTDFFIRRENDRCLVYTLLPPDFSFGADLRQKIVDAGGHIVSLTDIREGISLAARNDTARFCALAAAATALATLLIFRFSLRAVLVLIPMLTALAFTFGFFHFSATPMNLFHTAALPLVITLSVDYGIFMQTVLEGLMNAEETKAVILSALTTLAGFGSLLPAAHPALFSVGVTVTCGIVAALAAALLLQPRLVEK